MRLGHFDPFHFSYNILTPTGRVRRLTLGRRGRYNTNKPDTNKTDADGKRESDLAQTNSGMNAASEAKFRRMTTEPVEKLVRQLALPTMISMLVSAFYNLADTFFVRQLESDSMVAAVGVVLPLMNIIQAIGFYHGHGSGNYISRAYGRKDLADAEKMAATGFFAAVGCGLLLAVFGLLFRVPFARLLGAKTPDTIVNAFGAPLRNSSAIFLRLT